eukprot:m.20250 g.20250  ORF g.20250 m.20250 type:complete len:50 (+) comp11020_c0_seq1:155-304(+)
MTEQSLHWHAIMTVVKLSLPTWLSMKDITLHIIITGASNVEEPLFLNCC